MKLHIREQSLIMSCILLSAVVSSVVSLFVLSHFCLSPLEPPPSTSAPRIPIISFPMLLDFQVKEPLLALRIPQKRLFVYFLESCTHSVHVSFLSRVKMNSLNIMACWQSVTGYTSVLTRLTEKMSGTHMLYR